MAEDTGAAPAPAQDKPAGVEKTEVQQQVPPNPVEPGAQGPKQDQRGGAFVMADIDELARKHGVSPDAVRVLQEAVRHGGGRMAQFSHPDLGGMGQWSSGGMTQVGRHVQLGLAREGRGTLRRTGAAGG